MRLLDEVDNRYKHEYRSRLEIVFTLPTNEQSIVLAIYRMAQTSLDQGSDRAGPGIYMIFRWMMSYL